MRCAISTTKSVTDLRDFVVIKEISLRLHMGGIMLRKRHSDCMQANEELQRGNNTKESRTTSNENLKQQHNLLGIHEKHGYHAIVIYLKKDKYYSRFLCNHYAAPGFAEDYFGTDDKRTEDGEKHINIMKVKLEACREQSMQLERC